MKTSLLLSGVLVSITSLSIAAQDFTPEIIKPSPGNSVILSKMSNNGEWAVSESASVTDGDLRPIGGTLFNLKTLEQTPLHHVSGLAGVSDVTDDGSIVVGECNGKPGYWSRATDSWTELPTDGDLDIGRLNAVTPDGKIGVGYLSKSTKGAIAYAAAYDLTTNTRITLPNLPYLDMTNEDQEQNVFFDISPDGRFILGEMSMSYVYPAATCCYVYDRNDDSYKMIGYTENFDGDWIPDVPDTYFIDGPSMSPDGLWVTGGAYMVAEMEGSEWPREATHTFRYNVLTKKIEIFYDLADADVAGFSILNDGTVLAATPAENPYASSVVRHGNYFIRFDQIFSQVYGIDFNAVSGFSNTGKVLSVSDDGLTMIVLPNLEDTYILRLKESISDAAAKVSLLGNYTLSPAADAKISSLTSISLTFDRNVTLKGIPGSIRFASADGSQSYSPLSTNGCVVNGNKVTVTFRRRDLTPDMQYTLTIPEGMFTVAGDDNVKSPEIKASYTGRDKSAVKFIEASPADDSNVSTFDLTTNPLLITFDADVQLAENPSALLYQDALEIPIATLSVLAAKNQILVYPNFTQHLFKDSEYRVVIPAGIVTDISGNGPNEEIILNYHGIYVREINEDDKIKFSSDCSNYADFLFYEGDHLVPDITVSQWGFTQDGYPWLIVRGDQNSTDMALASHSMYIPAGKADDWLVIPQLFIPDSNCHLEFDAQSYLAGTDDDLHIYIIEENRLFNILTSEIIDDFRANGKLVFDETLTPGDSEEGLEGDWTRYNIDLSEYAGKNIYIAFVNENYDQSAIFIDNVKVIQELAFLTSVSNDTHLVKAENVNIKGTVTIASPLEEYTSIRLVLKDAEDNVVDTIEESGLSLKANDTYTFEFAKVLPLPLGEVTPYSIETTCNEETITIKGEIRNLSFQPKRKVVLEEYSGSECGNCPAGIRGIENIESLYPGMLIPIAIRTYQSDMLGYGMGAYSQYLGLDNVGAPSAIIDRKWIGYPMIDVNNTHEDYRFSGTGITNPTTGKDEQLWLDFFRQEIAEPAELGVELISTLSDDKSRINVEAQVSSALNIDKIAYNVFAVILENNLTTYQVNYYHSSTDTDFGEWGLGGKYGQQTVYPMTANDVARATFGTSYQGSSGLLPASLKVDNVYRANFSMPIPSTIVSDKLDDCHVAVMIIDTATGNVVNANIVSLNGQTEGSGVDETFAADANIGMAVVGDSLLVNTPGACHINIFDLSGNTVASASGSGLQSVNLNGFNGIILVKATDENGNARTAKFLVK